MRLSSSLLLLLGAGAASGFLLPASSKLPAVQQQQRTKRALRVGTWAPAARAGGIMMAQEFDYDVIIVGCGVGGHGAALHARSEGLKTAVFSGKDVGGTCVNRGCVPSKALLAAAGRVREMKDAHHLKALGITVDGDVTYDRASVAAHAQNLANRVKGNLENSLKALGVDVIESKGVLKAAHTIQADDGKTYTARDIILAPGAFVFVCVCVCVAPSRLADGWTGLAY